MKSFGMYLSKGLSAPSVSKAAGAFPLARRSSLMFRLRGMKARFALPTGVNPCQSTEKGRALLKKSIEYFTRDVKDRIAPDQGGKIISGYLEEAAWY